MRKYLAVALALMSTLGLAADAPWHLVDEDRQRGITTWIRAKAESPVREFRGRIELQHGLLEVFALVADLERSPEWLADCRTAEARPEFGEMIHWLHFASAWPAADRDALVQTTIAQNPADLTVAVSTRSLEGDLARGENMVRARTLQQVFLLEPISESVTRVTLERHFDPGGRIPAWIANRSGRSAVEKTLESLRARLPEAVHQLETVDDLKPPLPGVDDFVFPDSQPEGPVRRLDRDSPSPSALALAGTATDTASGE